MQEDFTLEALIALDVNNYREEIVAISIAAEKEHGLKVDLEKLENDWRRISFPVEYDDRVESYILKDLEEIFTALDESLALINAVLGSRYVKPLRTEAEKWKNNIMTLSDMIDQWINCQKNWMYLENIYVRSADIKKAMVEQTRRFDKVDQFFKGLMQNT
jgi:dynein heavy chain